MEVFNLTDHECMDKPRKHVKEKVMRVIDGITYKYHKNGRSIWSKGQMIDGIPEGYFEWYRTDGTLKRSGFFKAGVPVGTWITYDSEGNPYKSEEK